VAWQPPTAAPRPFWFETRPLDSPRHPAVHIKAITDLFQSGASMVNIHHGQADQNRVIEFYGKNVLPKAKSASMAA